MTNTIQKNEVFEYLSKGAFVCSNSSDAKAQKLYAYIEENFEELEAYFSEINFMLTQGDEYFYFTRPEQKADLNRKLEQAFRWIDLVDFFKTYDSSFASGYRFDLNELVSQHKVNGSMQDKLRALHKFTKTEKVIDGIRNLLELLRKDGFVELENEISDSYKVLASFAYLEALILGIHLSEEVQNEIPE